MFQEDGRGVTRLYPYEILVIFDPWTPIPAMRPFWLKTKA